MKNKKIAANFLIGLAIVLFFISFFIPDHGANDNLGMIGGLMKAAGFIFGVIAVYLFGLIKKEKKNEQIK